MADLSQQTSEIDTENAASPWSAVVLEGLQPLTEAAEAAPTSATEIAEQSNLASAFLAVAAEHSSCTAVQTQGECYSYAALAQGAFAVADYLKADPHFQAGDRVGLLLNNGPEYICAFYGTLLAGGIVTPLPPNVETLRLEKIRRTCDVDLFLSDRRTLKKRREFEVENADAIDLSQGTVDPNWTSPAGNPQTSPAMILFTSGSSGEPKGVMLSDQNLLANACSIIDYLNITSTDRALAVLPFYHAFGASVLHTHLLSGAALVLEGSITFPETIVEALGQHNITSFSGVPEAYYALLAYSSLGEKALPHLRTMTVAGGGLKPEAVRDVASRIAPADFVVMYGQSEATARLAYLPPTELNDRLGSIGKSIPGVELRVLKEDHSPAGVGELGELCARGDNIMLGYWDSPQETAAVLAEGWLHTGDLAITDDQGYFYVKARKNDLVKVQGHRTHPREIEDAVLRCKPEWRVVVTPYQQGDSVRLAMFVSPPPGEVVAPQAVRKLCQRELPRPKNPSHIEILEQIPLNASLKIDRAALALRAQAAAELKKAA